MRRRGDVREAIHAPRAELATAAACGRRRAGAGNVARRVRQQRQRRRQREHRLLDERLVRAARHKPVRIAMLGYDNKNNFTQWWWEGAKEEAKKQGVEVTLVDGKFDAKAQAAALREHGHVQEVRRRRGPPGRRPEPAPRRQAGRRRGAEGHLRRDARQRPGDQQARPEDPSGPERRRLRDDASRPRSSRRTSRPPARRRTARAPRARSGIMPGAAKFPTDALQFQVVKDSAQGRQEHHDLHRPGRRLRAARAATSR